MQNKEIKFLDEYTHPANISATVFNYFMFTCKTDFVFHITQNI